MNIRFLLACGMMIATMISGMAQPESGMPARERIDAQRVAFITQRLRLTPDESARFWPVYNEYRDAIKDLRDEFERPDLDAITDEEANALIDRHIRQEQRKLDLKINLLTRLRPILSPKKIIRLQAAELAFNRELLRRAQEWRKP